MFMFPTCSDIFAIKMEHVNERIVILKEVQHVPVSTQVSSLLLFEVRLSLCAFEGTREEAAGTAYCVFRKASEEMEKYPLPHSLIGMTFVIY
jgi:hypothetical protein